MAGEVSNGSKRAIGALLFMTSAMTTLDAYSTLNSSPWTAENFGGSPEKMRSLNEYVMHAVVFSMAYAAISSVMADNWLPALGAGAANLYLVWLYRRAAARGNATGSKNWENGG